MTAARKARGRRQLAAATRITLIALAAAGLTALTLVAAPAHADLATAPELIAPPGEEARGGDHGRDWQHAVQVVANLRAKRPEVPLVVLLGGSSARECTVHDDHWEQQIERRSEYDVLTFNLASKHRTYAQDLAFVKLLPRVPTIVYIGVNLGRFCIAPRRATVRLPRARPLRYYPQHVYSRRHIQSSSEKRYYVSYWMQRRWPEFQANYSGELAMLGRIIRACKRRHLRVALLDLPRDLPVIGSAFSAPVSRYHDGCARLARRWNIPWLHFVAGARLVDRDFFDIFHLVEPGREKFQSVLSDKTIRLLRKYHMPKPTPTPTPSPSPSTSPSPSASPSTLASH